MKRMLLLLVCAATILGAAASCSLYRNDRAYVPNEQYLYARDLYVETGSLDLVQQRLNALEWAPGKINETIYRLQKEFAALPEELPAPPAAK